MTVKLTGNFLATARCLIFEDGNGITWEFDPTTNELTANSSGSSANTAANLSGGLAGDIPYQTGVGATTFLAPGSNGNLLTLSGGLPVWEAVPTWNQNTTGTAAGLSATLAVGSGGTGQTTAITAFEALSPMTTTGDIIYAPGEGTAARLGIGSSGQVLTVGGGIPGWSTPATVPTAANPTGTVGLTTVDGIATTFMRSDGAPPIDQTIVPTWTGKHIFTVAGNAIQVENDTGAIAIYRTSASALIVALSSVAGWTGAGTNFTDLAIGAEANMNFYAGGTSTVAVSISTGGVLNFSNGCLGNTATSSLGYAAGSGGAGTQLTSRTTGVTLSKITGAITLFAAAGSATAATFTVTNTLVAATDTIVLSVKSSTNVYLVHVTAVAAGSFNITFFTTGGTSSDSPVINFTVIKGAAS